MNKREKNKKNNKINTPIELEKMNTVQVESAIRNRKILFFPVGTLEAHGRHLPIGTDTLCASNIALELAKRFRGIMAPPLSFGLTNLLVQTPVASFFSEDEYYRFVKNILKNFIVGGFEKIVIVNGHGGNRHSLMQIARELIREKNVAIAVINWWILAEKISKKVFGSIGGHAAAEETAAMLFFMPELVDSNLYIPNKDDYHPNDGLWFYPPPGEVLLYEDNSTGQPSFDTKKAQIFMTDLLNSIEASLKSWFKSLPRFKSGLRPRK